MCSQLLVAFLPFLVPFFPPPQLVAAQGLLPHCCWCCVEYSHCAEYYLEYYLEYCVEYYWPPACPPETSVVSVVQRRVMLGAGTCGE